MMKQLTTQFIILCTTVFGFQISNAQNAFWSEDFSATSGLPTGWTTEDASGGAGQWAWCANMNQITTCIINWDLYANQHDGSFFAGSTDNGFVFMDSDVLGTVSPNHIVRLTTTAIDCSGQPEVWVKFESLIGVYEVAATNNALLRVSTNGTDWTDFNIFTLSTATRWSANPEFSFIDISSVAAGEATVYLQFSWTGNYEYYWLLDDMQLYDADPTPIFVVAHDMRVNENFYAIAPNAVWPASQVECFGFLADIENVGSAPQTNVNLNINIDETGVGSVLNEDLFFGNITVDSIAENQPFDGCFTPLAISGTSYTGTYTVSADSVDLNPGNDTQTFDFLINDTIFAKEFGATNSVLPAASNWEGEGEPHSWAFGNYFYIVNGSPDWYASSATFGLGNASDPGIPGRLITLYLYKWDADTNEDGNMDPDERTRVAFNVYEITGDEALTDLINIPLQNFPSGDPGPIALESNQAYVLMLEYATNDEVDLAIASASVDYGAMVYRSELDGLAASRYGYMLGINGDLESEPYSSAGFASARTPVVRLNITPPVSAVEEMLDASNIIEISPNPVNNKINVKIDLVETQENVTVRIFDVNGRLLLDQPYENVNNEMLEFNVSNFANGAYFLRFVTETGVRTERFMVQH